MATEPRRLPALRYAPLVFTPLAPCLGLVPGGRWIVPLVAPLTLFLAGYAAEVRGRRYAAAWGSSLAWGALLSAGVVALTLVAPAAAADSILGGETYRTEMFRWIRTGIGAEGNWRQFLPQHALHLVAFAALTLLSGGYLGLVLGAYLLGTMSYFVGAFILAAGGSAAGILAWVPWAVVRVLAFIGLGVVLSRPVLSQEPLRIEAEERVWLWAAGCGILADAILKALVAPGYGRALGALLAAATAS